MDKTQLAEKRFRDKQKKEECKNFNNQLQKKNQYEINRRRALIREQNESNKEKK